MRRTSLPELTSWLLIQFVIVWVQRMLGALREIFTFVVVLDRYRDRNFYVNEFCRSSPTWLTVSKNSFWGHIHPGHLSNILRNWRMSVLIAGFPFDRIM